MLKIPRVAEWKCGSDMVWRSHWDAGVQRWQFLHTSALRYLRWHPWQPRCQYQTLPRDYHPPRTMSQSPLLSLPQLSSCTHLVSYDGFPGNSVTLRTGFKMLHKSLTFKLEFRVHLVKSVWFGCNRSVVVISVILEGRNRNLLLLKYKLFKMQFWIP